LLQLAAVGALAAALGVAGCGRKGGLDLPPGAGAVAPAPGMPSSQPPIEAPRESSLMPGGAATGLPPAMEPLLPAGAGPVGPALSLAPVPEPAPAAGVPAVGAMPASRPPAVPAPQAPPPPRRSTIIDFLID
jgi:predicted small lipoprotein YifL